MPDRLNRAARFSLARPIGDSFATAREIETISVTDLRVAFSIEKNLGKEPNECSITVTNLSEKSRQELQKKPIRVTLEAGYIDQLETIFVGDVRWAESKRDRVDWHTTFECGDGHRAYRYARLNKTFRKGVTVRRALQDTAAAMNFRLPPEIADDPSLDKQFAAGFAASGPARDVLSALLAPRGLTWSIQNGKLQILRETQTIRKGAALINQGNGLIGIPELSSPKDKGNPPTLHCETLLRADISPGGIIQLDSRSIKGRFKVRRVLHVGDTHGSEWKTEIEARPINR